jgi:tripartite-type tricarboxylate transporter receptor subunit TctC
MSRPVSPLHSAAVLLVAACALAPVMPAAAQDYPARPVKIIVPFSPGGAVDGPTRIVAQKLTERLGQQVVVENKPGAGATLGAAEVAKSPADGYTLLLASQTNAISASLYPKLTFDPIEDFVPIMLIGEEPGVLVVHPSFPAKSSGNGSGQHLFAAMFASMGGFTMNHVPYKGSGQATADLLGGMVPVSIPGTAGMMGHIKAGKLRPLATTGKKRAEALPDLPVIAEAVPGYEAYVWMGLLAPKGTPPAIVERLNRELRAVMAQPDVKAYYASHNLEIVASSPAEFAKFFRDEKERWARVVKETGAKID